MRNRLEILLHPYRWFSREISPNAAAIVLTELLFSMVHCMFFPYVTKYMQALGLSNLQIGFLSSFSTGLQMALCLLGGYLSDRFGRRNAVTVLDFIAWTVPMLLWAMARDFRWFLAATACNALFRIAMTPFQCFFIESMPPQKRVLGFSAMEFVCTAVGFTAPLGALLVSRMDLVPAMRFMYAAMAVNSLFIYAMRYFKTKETPVGEAKRLEVRGVSLQATLKGYFSVGKRFFASPLLLMAILLKGMTAVGISLRSTWLANLLIDEMGFSSSWPAWWGTIISIGTMLSLTCLMPRLLPHTHKTAPLGLGIASMAVSMTILVFCSGPSPVWIVLSALLYAVGLSVLNPCLSALVANEMPERERAPMNAMMTFLLMAIQTPSGYLGSLAADAGGYRAPFLIVLILMLVCGTLLVPYTWLRKRREAAESQLLSA